MPCRVAPPSPPAEDARPASDVVRGGGGTGEQAGRFPSGLFRKRSWNRSVNLWKVTEQDLPPTHFPPSLGSSSFRGVLPAPPPAAAASRDAKVCRRDGIAPPHSGFRFPTETPPVLPTERELRLHRPRKRREEKEREEKRKEEDREGKKRREGRREKGRKRKEEGKKERRRKRREKEGGKKRRKEIEKGREGNEGERRKKEEGKKKRTNERGEEEGRKEIEKREGERKEEMAYQSLGDPCQAAAMEWRGLTGDDAELRFILVGKSGGGKSATGNTILGRRAFKSILSVKNTTLRCQMGQGWWMGRRISVVDTPAMFDSDDYSEGVRREVMSCIQLSRPGPHALILVTQLGRFTAEDAAAAKCVRDIFGAESTRHTIVLFTHMEDLGGIPLEEYVRNPNKNLRDVIRQCRYRFCGFNNKATGDKRERQVLELMKTVQRTVSENGGGYYSNQLYLEPNLRDGIVKAFLAENPKIRKIAENALKWEENKLMTAMITHLLIIVYILVKLS